MEALIIGSYGTGLTLRFARLIVLMVNSFHVLRAGLLLHHPFVFFQSLQRAGELKQISFTRLGSRPAIKFLSADDFESLVYTHSVRVRRTIQPGGFARRNIAVSQNIPCRQGRMGWRWSGP
jgi:hypothetical protein